MKHWLVTIVPKYLNFTTFSKDFWMVEWKS